MKISQMIAREDFYEINRKTLETYFLGSMKQKKLYIYPELNAIITAKPSKKVKDYLYCEYSVKGNFLKRIAVYAYTRLCLNTFGLLSAKSITLAADMTDGMLIYPCNKKYRIFDFDQNFVDVIPKDGFPVNDLKNEISFRSATDCDFVPRFVSSEESRYKETILDGIPLARITEKFSERCDEAIGLLRNYAEEKGLIREVSAKEYADGIINEINRLADTPGKNTDRQMLKTITDALRSMIPDGISVPLTFSHGDLQPGNIWIERKTDKLYIIDWESWSERSIWYDQAVLFGKLRPNGVADYVSYEKDVAKTAIVLLEDIIFRLNELYNLILDYGEPEFGEYLKQIMQSREE